MTNNLSSGSTDTCRDGLGDSHHGCFGDRNQQITVCGQRTQRTTDVTGCGDACFFTRHRRIEQRQPITQWRQMTLPDAFVCRHRTDDQNTDPSTYKREHTDNACMVYGELVLRHRKGQYFDRSDPLTGMHHLTIADGRHRLCGIVIGLDECVDVDAHDSGVAGMHVGTTMMGSGNFYSASHGMSGDVSRSMVFVDFIGISNHNIDQCDVFVVQACDIIRRQTVAFGNNTLAGMITDVGAGNVADSRSGRTCYISHSAA